MNRVTANGVTYQCAGSVSVINAVVTIDGVRQNRRPRRFRKARTARARGRRPFMTTCAP
jgi:hypothetical protein